MRTRIRHLLLTSTFFWPWWCPSQPPDSTTVAIDPAHDADAGAELRQ